MTPNPLSPSSISAHFSSEDLESKSVEFCENTQDPQLLMKQAQVQLHAFEQVHQKLQEAYRKFENNQL